MAYSNNNEAYDLSLFDESAAPVLPVRKRKQSAEKTKEKTVQAKPKKKDNLLDLPQNEIHKNRRRKHNPLKLIVGGFGGIVAAVIIATIVVGQVQLTELNQQIINAEEQLSNSKSVYTQTQMKVESKLSASQIESYAESVLGMSKAKNTQKEFITLSGGDKVEVTSHEGENLFTQFVDSIANLWS